MNNTYLKNKTVVIQVPKKVLNDKNRVVNSTTDKGNIANESIVLQARDVNKVEVVSGGNWIRKALTKKEEDKNLPKRPVGRPKKEKPAEENKKPVGRPRTREPTEPKPRGRPRKEPQIAQPSDFDESIPLRMEVQSQVLSTLPQTKFILRPLPPRISAPAVPISTIEKRPLIPLPSKIPVAPNVPTVMRKEFEGASERKKKLSQLDIPSYIPEPPPMPSGPLVKPSKGFKIKKKTPKTPIVEKKREEEEEVEEEEDEEGPGDAIVVKGQPKFYSIKANDESMTLDKYLEEFRFKTGMVNYSLTLGLLAILAYNNKTKQFHGGIDADTVIYYQTNSSQAKMKARYIHYEIMGNDYYVEYMDYVGIVLPSNLNLPHAKTTPTSIEGDYINFLSLFKERFGDNQFYDDIYGPKLAKGKYRDYPLIGRYSESRYERFVENLLKQMVKYNFLLTEIPDNGKVYNIDSYNI